jgi:epoxyqueuosine reductase
MIHSIHDRSEFVRQEALKLGFEAVGFSRAGSLDDHAEKLTEWLTRGFHGEMGYMASHFDKRTDPRLLVDGAKTVISLSHNYFTNKAQTDPDAPVISKYAFGRDYHKVLKKKLVKLLNQIQEPLGIQNARAFTDSAPVLERAWAQRAGLGWIGKNTMLIHPRRGSYFFLSELIIDVELEYDESISDHCGRCRRCIDACPTGAILPGGYVMDGSKCISYATIETRKDIPEFFNGKMVNRVFGCDICIEVCPWNRFAKENDEAEFKPKEELLALTAAGWTEMDELTYERLFNGTAVRRAKFTGLRRNIDFLLSSGGDRPGNIRKK